MKNIYFGVILMVSVAPQALGPGHRSPAPVIDRDGHFGRDRVRPGLTRILAGTGICRDPLLAGTGTGTRCRERIIGRDRDRERNFGRDRDRDRDHDRDFIINTCFRTFHFTCEF